MIQVEKLCFSYANHDVLRNVSFSTQGGDFLSILGPNGVGKSTLFRCILGLLKPSSGSILLDGKPIAQYSSVQLARHIAYIPQSHNPVFNFSVQDMVLMGTTAQMGQFSLPGKEQQEQVACALERLGIAHLRDRGYGSISGGERQLALIARGIAQKAKILVLDEPCANLDFGNRIRVMQTLQNLVQDGYCVVQSTHDPDQAYLYSTRILALQGGQVLACGEPKEVYTSQLVSSLYGVEVEVCQVHEVRVAVPVGAGIKGENDEKG